MKIRRDRISVNPSEIGRLTVRTLTLVCLVFAFQPRSAVAQSPSWRTEAASSSVVVGMVQVEMGTLADAERRGGGYVTIRIAVFKVLKGSPTKELSIRVFAAPEGKDPFQRNPSVSQLRALNGKKRIAYVVRIDNPDDPSAHGLWLANRNDGTALLEATNEMIASARAQIEQHQRWLREPLPTADPKIQKEVSVLVEGLVATPERQKKSLEQLEALGKPAVVAIVHSMDDRRKLARPQITLRNNFAGAFEGTRHYGPKLVVDALAAILNQVTLESFGFIENGGSEAERAQCVAGWKLYVRHLSDG